jgi:hypothetical protein
MRKRTDVVSFRIGDLVTYSRYSSPTEIGIITGIAKFQMMYRVHGLRVLWSDGGEELAHPSELRMIGRATCNEPAMMIESNYE